MGAEGGLSLISFGVVGDVGCVGGGWVCGCVGGGGARGGSYCFDFVFLTVTYAVGKNWVSRLMNI